MNPLLRLFEKLPEKSYKNNLRYFLAFNRFVPKFIQDFSPVKGYQLYYHLKEGDVVIDAGAYPGDFSVWASRKVGSKGKVICFEPDKKNLGILEQNMLDNGIYNYILINKGLWNKNTKIKIKPEGLRSEVGDEGQEIEVVKLDDELKKWNISKVDFIKMDIEGAEIEAIQGCKETLKNNNVNVAIASYHIVNGRRTSRLIDKYLRGLNYYVDKGFYNHITTYGCK